MNTYIFDQSNIMWADLEGFDHLQYSILAIDKENNIADILFKFSANEKIILHRHKAYNNTFVLQGEHRIYTSGGMLKEVRVIGSMTCSAPDTEPHREGAGNQDAIVFFSIRGEGVLYEFLDDNHNIINTMSFQDLVNLKNVH